MAIERTISNLVRLLMVIITSVAFAGCSFNHGKDKDKVYSQQPYEGEKVIPFFSPSEQSDWDLKREIGRIIGSKPVIFFDNDMILDMKGLTRSFHQVEKHGMISLEEIPGSEFLYGMQEMRQLLRSPSGNGFLAYFNGSYKNKTFITLFSTVDGQNFKPVFTDQVPSELIWNDLPVNDIPDKNNIVAFYIEEGKPLFNLAAQDNFTSFFEFPEGKEFRYGAFFINKEPLPRLSNLFGSDDGLNWISIPHKQLEVKKESNRPAYDPFRDRYMAYLRHWDPILGASTRWRKVLLSESYEQKGEICFTEPVLVFNADKFDPVGADIYNMFVFSYAGKYIGLPEVYNRRSSLVDQALFETITVELAFSHEGYRWQRINQGNQFIPQGSGAAWDSGMIFAMGSPVILGNQLYFYYSGTNARHHESGDSPAARIEKLSGTGRASLRIDGFISLDAGPEGGSLITVPFFPQGKYLYINADAEGGEILVEVLQDGHTVGLTKVKEGDLPSGLFRMDKCIPVISDSIAHIVRWENNENFIDNFAEGWNDQKLFITRERNVDETAISLRINIKNARLYSFWFANEITPPTANRLLP